MSLNLHPIALVLLQCCCLSCFFGCEHLYDSEPQSDTSGDFSYFPPPDTIILSQMDISEQLQAQWVNYTKGIPILENHFTPVDQTLLNPYFSKFMEEFYEAIETRDANFLIRHLDEHVKMSDGIKQGKSAFIEKWSLKNRPEQSGIWTHLESIFSLGGIFTNKKLTSFTAPYTFFIQLDNPTRQKVITGTEVRIRNAPAIEGGILGSLSYEVVSIVPLGMKEEPVSEYINGETYTWERVQTSNGTIGYVYGKYLRSTRDYRTNFLYQNGTWKMSYFISGH